MSEPPPDQPAAPAVALCIICRRRQVAVGLLCWPDRDRVANHLNPANTGTPFDADNPTAPVRPPSIPRLYAALADLEPDLGELAGEHAAAAHLDAHPMALRDTRSKATGPGPDDDGVGGPRSVVATLGGWAGIVHLEHGDPLPQLATARAEADRLYGSLGVRLPSPDQQAVDALGRWLLARLDWICAQPWIDELVGDLRLLTAQLRAGTGDPGSRRLGPCRAPVDEHGERTPDGEFDCMEPLHVPAPPPRAPDEPLALPEVVCSACGTRWSGLDLLELARERGMETTT